MKERIRSIPARTMRDVWLSRPKIPHHAQSAVEPISPSQFDIKKHTFKKPSQKVRVESRPTFTEKITWEVETIENYNNRGDLGLILKFFGVEFLADNFAKGHDPNNAVLYTPVRQLSYKERPPNAFLIIVSQEDILEFQISPKRDVNPFFREEILIPELQTKCNPKSMMATQNQGIVIVSYKLVQG